MSPTSPDPALLSYLESFLTPARRERILGVLAERTAYLRVVVEDLFQPHNASAIMRTCECFGLQHLHVIETRHRFRPNRDVAMGSAKWITLHRHREAGADNATACLAGLKASGYRIVGTSLRPDAVPLPALPLDRPIVLVFGGEKSGLSPAALAQADIVTTIPMYGFTQSFNVSVSAAVALTHLTTRLRAEDRPWALSPAEHLHLRDAWVRATLKTPEALERRYRLEHGGAMPEEPPGDEPAAPHSTGR